jgi:hypothetical protein
MLHVKDRFMRLGSVLNSRRCVMASAAAVALAAPLASQAAGRFDRGADVRHDDDRRGDWGHDNDRNVNVDVRIGGGRPEYETRETRVWVPPVYRTVVDRKWVEPVYRNEVERVWVPDRYEDREVQFRGGEGRWRTRVERVVVEPGHYESVEHRVCVSEGHWENCERQELVSAGHYETRVERVRAPYRVSPFQVVNPMLGRVGVAGL